MLATFNSGFTMTDAQMLTKDEHPNPYRYLQSSSRDFVAILAR